MDGFDMNGVSWRVVRVSPSDPVLVDRTGAMTVATTDPSTLTVYVSSELGGRFLGRVLVHEIAHCAIFSFGLVDDIHRMCHPAYWIEAEEWVCNFLADYGTMVFDAAYSVLGDDAVSVVPREYERMVA